MEIHKKFLLENLVVRDYLGDLEALTEDNIKMNTKETSCVDVN